MITLNEITKYRLANQQIAATKFKTVKDIVSWMGAMQAQDFAMAKLTNEIIREESRTKPLESE